MHALPPVLCQNPVRIENVDVFVSRWKPSLPDCLSKIRVQGSTRIGPRKPSATTACHSGSNSSPPAPAKNGSAVLGLALPNVEELAGIIDHRKAGYGRSMASERICPILDAAVETKTYWSSENWGRDQGFDPEDCRSEPALGKPTGSRGTVETWNSNIRADCSPAYTEEEESSITDLAVFSGKSLLGTCLDRLSRCAHGDVLNSVCIDCPRSPPSTPSALQRNRTPYGTVDSGADHPSLS
jgi:hypothetical protein